MEDSFHVSGWIWKEQRQREDLAAWDSAVRAWWKWQSVLAGKPVARLKTSPTKAMPFKNTYEGTAYISAMLRIPEKWKTPNSVACGE